MIYELPYLRYTLYVIRMKSLSLSVSRITYLLAHILVCTCICKCVCMYICVCVCLCERVCACVSNVELTVSGDVFKGSR